MLPAASGVLLKYVPLVSKFFKNWYVIVILILALLCLWFKSKADNYSEDLILLNANHAELKLTLEAANNKAIFLGQLTEQRNSQYQYYEQKASELEAELKKQQKASRQRVKNILNSATPNTSAEAIQLLRDALQLEELEEFD